MIALTIVIEAGKKVQVYIGESKWRNRLSKKCVDQEIQLAEHIKAMIGEYFRLVLAEQKAKAAIADVVEQVPPC